MKFTSLYVRNFKSIRELHIQDIENAMILVGKNNTGKTVVLYAIMAAAGQYTIKDHDFFDPAVPIEVGGTLELTEEDLHVLQERGVLGNYKKYDLFRAEFDRIFPSYADNLLPFEFICYPNRTCRYGDGTGRENRRILEVMPTIYFIDSSRNIDKIQDDILQFQGKESLRDLREDRCMFDHQKKCNRCFQCIGVINKKTPEELSLQDTARLMEYKLYRENLDSFSETFNSNFRRNGGRFQEVDFKTSFNVADLLKIDTVVTNTVQHRTGPLETLSAGFKSIYILSLLETYIQEKDSRVYAVIMVEDPEIYLHPSLQKVASEILYNLSKKNQVMFSTHSPNMITNFSQKQIKKVMINDQSETVISENEEIDDILDDLGYTANDLMNVSFVFIVEGKQDFNRLPMLLKKYYSEMYDDKGNLQRIAIVPVNSCTNIKTYANLKYINKLYLKDQFLMIRDSDGKNPSQLTKELCGYYKSREQQDQNNLPRVTPKNVLILKYYSFENYFLDPKTMVKIGVIKNEEQFYNILYSKWRDSLYKLNSAKRMLRITRCRINSKQDLKNNIENVKIYVRGHNLFDIFYGRYKGKREDQILQAYVDAAPRDTFRDILDAIDSFVYFENRKQNR